MKTCSRCNTNPAVAKQSWCRPCFAAHKRERWAKADHATRRNNGLKKYGITQAVFEQMLVAQEHRCAICAITFDLQNPKGPTGAVVDHDHETGEVRGLLCQLCNRGIGCLRDNARIAQSAAHYLERARVDRAVL